MEHILLKAYADGIVESLKDRDTSGFSFAAVDLGESGYSEPNEQGESDVYSMAVKFWWEVHNRHISEALDYSAAVTLRINLNTGKVTIGDNFEWVSLAPVDIHASADWVTQQA
jgi:hypothetical protein